MSEIETRDGESLSNDEKIARRDFAAKLYRAGEFERADSEWQKIAIDDPDFGATARLFRARIAWRRGDRTKALEHYRAVIAEEPGNLEAIRTVCQADREGNEADRIAAKLAENFAGSRAHLFAEASASDAKGSLDEAVGRFEEIAIKWPDETSIGDLINLLLRKGAFERALAEAQRALESFPMSQRLQRCRSRALKAMIADRDGDPAQSIEAIYLARAETEKIAFRDLCDIAIACAEVSAGDDADYFVTIMAQNIEDPDYFDFARARITYLVGKDKESDSLWKNLAERGTEWRRQALMFRARLAARGSRGEEAASYYREFLENFGSVQWTDAHLEAARFMVKHAIDQGNSELAWNRLDVVVRTGANGNLLDELQTAIRLASDDKHEVLSELQNAAMSTTPDPSVWLQLIEAEEESGVSLDTRLETIDRAIVAFPQDQRFVTRKATFIRKQLEKASRSADGAAMEAMVALIKTLPDLRPNDIAGLVSALIMVDRFDHAEQLLEAGETSYGQTDALMHCRALLHYRQNRMDQADHIWKDLSERDPSRWRVSTTYRARIALRDKRRNDAGRLFQALWDRHADHDEAAQFLIQARLGGNDLVGARSLRQTIAERRPDSKLLALCDAGLANADHNTKKAEQILNDAVERWPDQIDVRLQLIDHLIRNNQFDQGLEQVDVASARFPLDRRPLDRKLAILSAGADTSGTVALIDEMLAKFPDRIDLYLRKARILANIGHRNAAIQTCHEGLEQDRQAEELWRIAISCYLNLNEPKRANELLDEALTTFASNDVATLVKKSELLLVGERYADAAAAAESALSCEPQNVPARVSLAKACAALGHWKSSLRHYYEIAEDLETRQSIAADMARMTNAIAFVDARLPPLTEAQPSDPNLIKRLFSSLIGVHTHKPQERQYPHSLFEAIAAGNEVAPYEPQQSFLHVTSSLGPGGAERQLTINAIEQFRTLSDLQPVVAALSLSTVGRRNFFQEPLESAGVEVVHLQDEYSRGRIRNFIANHPEHMENFSVLASLPSDAARLAIPLYREVIERRPAVLHLWQDTTAVVGGLAGLLAGVPRLVFATRSTRPTERQRSRPYLHAGFKAMLKLPQVVMINNSRNGALDYEDWLGDPNVEVATVYNGYDFEEIQSRVDPDDIAEVKRELQCPEDCVLFGGVMRLSSEKRPDLWLATAVELVRNQPNVRAVLVGDGPMAPGLKRSVAEAGLSDRISLVGAKSPVEPWMTAMDVLLLSSVTEGLPNVLIEAQSLGTPVVSTDVGGAAETFVDGRTGLLVRGDASGSEIAVTLSQLLDDPEQLAAMGRAGADWVRKKFSIDRTISDLDSHYRGTWASER